MMSISKMLEDEISNGVQKNKEVKFFYQIDLNPNLKNFRLIEIEDSFSKSNYSIIARSFGWRAEMMRKFSKKIIIEFKNDIERLEDYIYILQPNLASRIFITQKILTSLKNHYESEIYTEFLLNLNNEEVSYWAWKIADKKEKAIRALKLIL